MKVYNKHLRVPMDQLSIKSMPDIFSSIKDLPIRFVVTDNTKSECDFEVDLVDFEGYDWDRKSDIFEFRKREFENNDSFNVVLIIPTGVGCELGGHEGDANPVARLIASACDTLITHPNVVNSTDYNEMKENTLYVEGSILTRLLMGQAGLQRVRSNRMLLVVEKGSEHFVSEIVNSASVARITLGSSIDVVVLDEITKCAIDLSDSGRATGILNKVENLFRTDMFENYDAIALSTHIERNTEWSRSYFTTNKIEGTTVNPTGGIEAMMTHCLSEYYNKPFAHAPSPQEGLEISGVVDPKISGYTGSIRHIHCCLKGLHKSPKIVSYDKGLNAENVSCVIIPDGCIGLPVLACIEQGIPLIAVDNKNIMRNDLARLPFQPGKFFKAKNYLEAVGIMYMLKEGLALDTVTRPIEFTKVHP
jgi:hypothetical protein